MIDGFRWGRRFRAARKWSNRVLRKIAPLFNGDVLNVSGWQDEDKEGCHYRNYFTSATSYALTNYGGYRGQSSAIDINLDLEAELPKELHRRADIVFNHTTLEHVFDIFTATRNLCLLSRDIVIVVVPAIQEEHSATSFGDYWRFTSEGLRRLFESNGFSSIVLVSSPYNNCAVYHLLVASRHPERWAGLSSINLGKVNDGKDLFRENIIERLYSFFR